MWHSIVHLYYVKANITCDNSTTTTAATATDIYDENQQQDDSVIVNVCCSSCVSFLFLIVVVRLIAGTNVVPLDCYLDNKFKRIVCGTKCLSYNYYLSVYLSL